MRYLRQLALNLPPGILTALLLTSLTTACADKAPPKAEPSTPTPVTITPDQSAPKAILLITIDTLRADHTGPDGYELPTTPFLDEVAKRGINFTQAYATSSFTPTSVASIMTGLYPSSHGVESGYFDPQKQVAIQDKLADSLTTLGEAVKSQGYTTLGVPANRHLAADLGFAQGFDHYYEQAGFSRASALGHRAERMMKEAFGDDVKEGWRARWPFLWVHYIDPHDPYASRQTWPLPSMEPIDENLSKRLGGKTHLQLKEAFKKSDPLATKTLKTLYDGDIHYTDHHIAKLWEHYGFDDDTLVIITSDHGEEFMEHGQLGHAKTLYQESVRVPFIISWPAKYPQGLSIDTPVSIVDIYPTIRDILGMPIDESLQGQSLTPLLQGQSQALTRPILMELTRKKVALTATIDGNIKHIEATLPVEWRGSFDITKDPLDSTNLYSESDERSRKAFERLRGLFEGLPPPPTDKGTATIQDDEELDALKAMGYIE